jgi:histidinol phosphatase-like enzyme
VNTRVTELLQQEGIEILGCYMCPHAPEARCSCRKPQPGLAIAAASDFGLTLLDCYVIGDKQSDLELADSIGGVGILMTTGYGASYAGWASASGRPVFPELALAADYIRNRQPASSSLVSIAESR